jgi:hypothetical protein
LMDDDEYASKTSNCKQRLQTNKRLPQHTTDNRTNKPHARTTNQRTSVQAAFELKFPPHGQKIRSR